MKMLEKLPQQEGKHRLQDWGKLFSLLFSQKVDYQSEADLRKSFNNKDT